MLLKNPNGKTYIIIILLKLKIIIIQDVINRVSIKCKDILK